MNFIFSSSVKSLKKPKKIEEKSFFNFSFFIAEKTLNNELNICCDVYLFILRCYCPLYIILITCK